MIYAVSHCLKCYFVVHDYIVLFHSYEIAEKHKFMETESRLEVTILSGYTVWGDEKVLG